MFNLNYFELRDTENQQDDYLANNYVKNTSKENVLHMN